MDEIRNPIVALIAVCRFAARSAQGSPFHSLGTPGPPMSTLSYDPHNEWAVEIGRFMLAFGSIEHVTHLCLRDLPTEKLEGIGRSLLLSKRIALVQSILENREHEAFTRLANLLNKASKLAEERNLIAHNPLVLDVYADTDDQMFIQAIIRSARSSGRSTDLPGLKRLRVQVESLAANLLSAFHEALIIQKGMR